MLAGIQHRPLSRSGRTVSDHQRSSGFTLIELTVVLIIIALLLGGIAVAKELIYTAKLRSVTAQLESYNAGVVAFELKYDGLPGDFAHAVKFRLGDADCPNPYPCPPPFPSSSYEHAGCNGNGNLNLSVENSTMDYGWCPENLNFWHHLSRAGLIDGTFDGKSLDGPVPVFGQSAPATRVRGVGISAAFNSYYIADSQGLGLTPFEADYFDRKWDDGRPLTGRVGILNGGACHDAVANTYNVTWAIGQCSIRVREIPGFAPPQNE